MADSCHFQEFGTSCNTLQKVNDALWNFVNILQFFQLLSIIFHMPMVAKDVLFSCHWSETPSMVQTFQTLAQDGLP